MCIGITYKFACSTAHAHSTPLQLCEHPICEPLPGVTYNIKEECFRCAYEEELKELHERCDGLYKELVEKRARYTTRPLPLEEAYGISARVERECWRETDEYFDDWLRDGESWVRRLDGERLELLRESFQRDWFCTVDKAGCRDLRGRVSGFEQGSWSDSEEEEFEESGAGSG